MPRPLEDEAHHPGEVGQRASALAGRALPLIVLAGVLLRFTGLAAQSLWFDEAMSVYVSRSDDVVEALVRDRHPPLYFLLLRVWGACTGDGEALLRSASAIVSCVTLLCFARLARRLLPPKPATLAAALLAVSPYSIWYGQELRGYVLLELATVLTLLGLVPFVSGRPTRRRDFALLAAAGFLAFGSHYMGGLLLATVAGVTLGLGLRRRLTVRAALAPPAATCAGMLLWMPWLMAVLPAQLSTPWGGTARSSLRDLVELPARLVLVEADVLPGSLHVLGYFIGGATLASIVLCARAALQKRQETLLAMSLALGAPIVVALGLTLVTPPSFTPRYLMVAEPALVLVIAAGLMQIAGRRVRAVTIALFLGTCVTIAVLHKFVNMKEDFRSACAELERHWQPGEPLLSITGTPSGFSEAPVTYYLRARPEILAALTRPQRLVGQGSNLRNGTRIHVVFREAPYAYSDLHSIEECARLVFAGDKRHRVQYLIFQVE